MLIKICQMLRTICQFCQPWRLLGRVVDEAAPLRAEDAVDVADHEVVERPQADWPAAGHLMSGVLQMIARSICQALSKVSGRACRLQSV